MCDVELLILPVNIYCLMPVFGGPDGALWLLLLILIHCGEVCSCSTNDMLHIN